MKVGAVYQQTEPDTSPIWLFEHVFGDDEGYLATFTGRQARLENPDARQNELTSTAQRSFTYPAARRLASDYLIDEAERGRDAYYGVHLFREAGNRRAKNAGGKMRSLWLDEDEGHYPEDGPEPTAVVYSSYGRRHLYWRLTHSLSAEWIVGMNRRVAAWAGGDSSKAGLSSVLRVPGTYNYKRHPEVAPVVGELTGVEPWDPEVMEQAIPPLPEPEAKPRFDTPYDGPEVDLLDYLDEVKVLYEAPDDGGTKFAIVCPWVAEHSGGDCTGTYAGQFLDGAPWFHCHHEHCEGRGWREFKDKTFPKGRIRLRIPKLGRSRTSGRVVIHLAR